MTEPADFSRRLDFLVIGTQRAGTTALFEFLRAHPQLHLPSAKELPFFCYRDLYERGWEEFAEHWQFGAPDEMLRGKVTPHYMSGAPWGDSSPTEASIEADLPPEEVIPRRIRAAFPQIRLVAVLRDPVARAISGYRLAWMRGWEERNLEEAFVELLGASAQDAARYRASATNGYVVWGEYDRILSGYLRVFPREQLLILSYSSLRERPSETMSELLGYLGVETADQLPRLGEHNASGGRRRFRGLQLESIQGSLSGRRWARAVWRRLPARSRDRIDTALAAFDYRLSVKNRRPGRTDEVPPDVDLALRRHYEPHLERLSEVIGPVAGVTETVVRR